MKHSSLLSDGKVVTYEESFWTGKKKIKIDGVLLNQTSKKEFQYEEKTYKLSGNFITGAKLVGEKTIVVVPNLKTWEYILACLPLIMVFLGGAIGGLFGALFAMTSILVMRNCKNTFVKVLLSLVFAGCTFLAWEIVVLLLAGLMA